jgi:hypothetical protein
MMMEKPGPVFAARRLFNVVALVTAVALTACATKPPSLLVYSSGFSFANYDFVIVGKPDGANTSTSLYGMDVEFANLMSRYNMKVIGDKEFAKLGPADQRRTLHSRMALIASQRVVQMSVSFDDVISGRTGASITAERKGVISNLAVRNKTFAAVAKEITAAIARDKNLQLAELPTVED